MTQQKGPPTVLRRLGDVHEPDEVEARARVAREHLALEALEDVEERDEDRDLEDDRQARRGRVDLVLAVELHQLLVLPLLVVLPALLDLLHLRRMRLEVLHRVDLPHRHRDEHEPDEHDERDDRPRPREPCGRVEPLEEVGEEVLDRPERVRPRRRSRAHTVLRRVAGTASGRRPGRRRRGSTGCSAAVASPRGSRHGRARAHGRRRTRTASSSGGTCTCPAGVSSPNVWRQACTSADAEPPHAVHLADHLAHLLDEPFVAAGLGGLGEAGPRGEDVVTPRRDVGGRAPPRRRGAAA